MYCTVEEIKDSAKIEFLEIAISDYINDEETKSEEIDRILKSAIEDSTAEINGYLLKKYSINKLKKSSAVNKFCKDIALYNILSRSGNDESGRENNYYLRYKNAIKFLESVAKGQFELPSDTSDEEKTNSRNFSSNIKISSSIKLFGRSNLGGM